MLSRILKEYFGRKLTNKRMEDENILPFLQKNADLEGGQTLLLLFGNIYFTRPKHYSSHYPYQTVIKTENFLKVHVL